MRSKITGLVGVLTVVCAWGVVIAGPVAADEGGPNTPYPGKIVGTQDGMDDEGGPN